jgi:ribosome-associated protein
MLELVVKAADSKRAEDIVAIANEIIEESHKNQVEVKRIEGKESARWVLIDLGDIIVHVFHSEEREFYNLEKLWSDAPLVNISSMVD